MAFPGQPSIPVLLVQFQIPFDALFPQPHCWDTSECLVNSTVSENRHILKRELNAVSHGAPVSQALDPRWPYTLKPTKNQTWSNTILNASASPEAPGGADKFKLRILWWGAPHTHRYKHVHTHSHPEEMKTGALRSTIATVSMWGAHWRPPSHPSHTTWDIYPLGCGASSVAPTPRHHQK